MSEWKIAHEMLSRLARERAAAEAEEGRWLLRAQRATVHAHLGFASFVAYVEELFGYKPRSTLEKLRVAAALEQLPESSAALEQGQLCWSALRELTRVAVRETESEWLELARGKSLRQIEEWVAGKRPGDTPVSSPDPRLVRHVLRFEVAAETFALFREALKELRRRSDATLDDDSALLEMARLVLGGPRDEGRSSYQIALSVCPECARGRQPANGKMIGLSPEIVRMAECDAQRMPSLERDDREEDAVPRGCEEPARAEAPGHTDARPEAIGPEAVAEAVRAETVGSEAARPDARAHSKDSVHVGTVFAHVGRPDALDEGARPRAPVRREAPVHSEDSVHVGPAPAPVGAPPDLHPALPGPTKDTLPAPLPRTKQDISPVQPPRAQQDTRPASPGRTQQNLPPAPLPRAQQDIPPALRRAVLLRDERRCRVPGCRNATFLDVHHLWQRTDGGPHTADNLVTVCSAHHRALHRGKLRCTGDARHFRVLSTHRDTLAQAPRASVLEVQAKVFSGLCQLGFRAAAVRAVLVELRERQDLIAAPAQQWLRAALQRLHPRRTYGL